MKQSLFLMAPLLLALNLSASGQPDEKPWVVYEPAGGPGKGKHIVFVSGDEEYRSEETLPQLAKILARHHGFKCTVLFAIDPKTGYISPSTNNNIPGLEVLASADLMVLFTRFRNLPDEQMKPLVDYVESGKPVIGLRTATHAFRLGSTSKYLTYTYTSKEWDGGFGRQVLGETWVTHRVPNGKGSTRGLLAKGQENHPILRGLKDGDIWGPTGMYGINLPMRATCTPLVLGQALVGNEPTDAPAQGKYNDPLMPVAWTNTWQASNGKPVRTFTTTLGASQDFASEGLRRLLVNAAYWALDMEKQIPERSQVDLVGAFRPTQYKSGGHVQNVKPSSLRLDTESR